MFLTVFHILKVTTSGHPSFCFVLIEFPSYFSTSKIIKMNVTKISRAVLKQIRFTSFRVMPAASKTFSHQMAINETASRRNFSVFSKSPDYSEVPLMDLVTFEAKSTEALESLTDYFDELVESDLKLAKADVAYSVRDFFF